MMPTSSSPFVHSNHFTTTKKQGSRRRHTTMARTHYETLGIARDARMEEIKAAFRKLSKETHPDVAAATTANADRFKEVSHAASILTNKSKREAYDMGLQRPFGSPTGGLYDGGAGFAGRAARATEPKATSGFQIFLQTIFRPRNMLLGSLGVYATVVTARHVFHLNEKPVREGKEFVQAWKNPQTGEWEQPAPWDPLYRRLKPTLEMVPRGDVKSRRR
jgi:curved DNA-binding protein CbpA